jgi:Zn-finger nucleic acid-binding protein
MFLCPSCHHRQARTEVFKGVVWVCGKCGGRVAAIATLRKVADFRTIEQYWSKRRKPEQPHTRVCPACMQRMKEVSVTPHLPELDVCYRCQLFWFDPGEYERTPPALPRIEPDEERQRRLMRQRADTLRTIDVPQPNWQLAFCLFGMPAETTASRVRRYPLVTWWTCGIVAALALISFMLGRRGSPSPCASSGDASARVRLKADTTYDLP